MYKSKSEIEKKLKQVKYLFKKISRYEGKIFVNNGMDIETGSYPLQTDISSLVTHSRSIIQYAYKEANESNNLPQYEEFVTEAGIFKFFKDIRDSEIHEYLLGLQNVVKIDFIIDRDNPAPPLDTDTKGAVEHKSEKSKDTDKEDKRAEVTTILTQKIHIDDSVIEELNNSGRTNLAEAAKEGKDLYEEQSFEGEKDIFRLCEIYIEELERFIEFGIEKGFIS